MFEQSLWLIEWPQKWTLSCHHFFFLECGRCRAKARSLHEHKQKTHLYKGNSSPLRRQIDYNWTQKTQANQTRRPANPPARLAFRQRKQRSKRQNQTNNQTKNGARAQTKTPTIDSPWDAVACPLHHNQKRANELKITACRQTWRLKPVSFT